LFDDLDALLPAARYLIFADSRLKSCLYDFGGCLGITAWEKPDNLQERDEKMDYNTLPVGLGLAFATNRAAMDRFVDMTDEEKKEFVERSRGVLSKKEMDSLVNSLAEEEEPDLHLEDVNQIFKGPSIG